MVKKIVLSNPVMINGEARKVLTYDTDLITPNSFAKAEGLARKKNGLDAPATTVELDFTFQLYLLLVAIADSNQDIDILDLERIKGAKDVMKLYREGRSFIEASAEEELTEEVEDSPLADNSEEQHEAMDELSIPTLED